MRVYNDGLLDTMCRETLGQEEPSDFSPTGRSGADGIEFDRGASLTGFVTMNANGEAHDVPGVVGAQSSAESLGLASVASTRDQLAATHRMENDEKHAKMQEEIKATMERRRDEKSGRADAKFQEMFASVMEGIDGHGLLAEMDDVLQKTDASKAKKTREIHAEWDEAIFRKIQKQILHYVNSIDPAALTTRLAFHYDAFLNTVNTKQEKNAKSGVFRDVVLVHEYDPLLQRRDTIKYKVNSLDDPTQRDVYKTLKEKLAVGLLNLSAARAGVTMRSTLDLSHWPQLDSTPYGRLTDSNGDMKPQHVGIHSHKRGESHVVMDAYDVPTGPEVTEREQSRLKGMPALAGHRVGRPNLRDLITSRVDHSSGFTGGDMWLEAKGKKFPDASMPVPGLSEERKDLFDVVNMCSDPNDARPQGDQWLSAKGKMVVLPPSVVYSDRKSLHDTLQQSAPVFVRTRPDQTCGDLWLDKKGKGAVDNVKQSDVEGGLFTVLSQTEQQQ